MRHRAPRRPSVRAALVLPLLALACLPLAAPQDPATAPQDPAPTAADPGDPGADGVLREPRSDLEAFALADDRAAVLAGMLPGSVQHFYLRALLLQQSGRLDEVPALLDAWAREHGRQSLHDRVRLRQAALLHERDPAAGFAALREELVPRFDDQPRVPGRSPDLPTRLDPARVARDTLVDAALDEGPHGLALLSQAALADALARDLDDARLRELLRRLERPDAPGLVDALLRELALKTSGGFGSLPIHHALLTAQYAELAERRPALLASETFVDAWVRRLAPPDGVELDADDAALRDYLERLEDLAVRLPPVHNGLRALVLARRLELELRAGRVDRERLRRYLELPRAAATRPPERTRHLGRDQGLVSGGDDHGTLLAPLPDDEPLLRALFDRLFRTAESWEEWSGLLREEWLVRVFAETKILHGIGDMQRWAALLDDPAARAELAARVELDFAPGQAERFAADEPVVLELDVKNVPTLLVELYEIDAFTVHTELDREVDADLDLEGLLPNASTTHRFDSSPLQRVRRRFEFPELDRPGVWVVDFVGNGLVSRALIQKGALSFTEEGSRAGQVFRVYDERDRHLRDAAVWLDGRVFEADDAGRIVVPYTSEPRWRTAVLRHGERSERVSFTHHAESLQLELGAHVPRESLVAGAEAPLLLRPRLRVAGAPVALEHLEDVVLRVRAVSRDGTASVQEIEDLALQDGEEFVHTLRVPEELAELSVQLEARVRVLSTGALEAVSAEARFAPLNRIAATLETAAPLLQHTAEGWVLELRGRAGEPLPDRPVPLEFWHRDVRRRVHVALKTDAEGRAHLGALPGIQRVSHGLPAEGATTWELGTARVPHVGLLAGTPGETLRVALDAPLELRPGQVALIETRAGAHAVDRFEHLALVDGFVELRDLPAGRFELSLPGAPPVVARVAPGPEHAGWLHAEEASLPLDGRAPLQVTALALEGESLTVQLAHAGPRTRVHVIARHWVPVFDAGSQLALAHAGRTLFTRPDAVSRFHAGRTLGDEQRYILERRLAPGHVGNMLRRPTLLLNRLALDEVEAQSLGVGSGSFGRGAGKVGARGASRRGSNLDDDLYAGEHPGTFADIDYLASPAVVLVNLRPDDQGRVVLPRERLGPAAAHVQVVAVDDDAVVTRALPLEEPPLPLRDRSLRDALPPDAHAVQQRRLEVHPAGAVLELPDPASTRAELHDSLASVFRLYRALSDDPKLAAFAFLMRWPELDRAAKLAAYSEHACHELHVFLHEKNPDFFAEVVRPFLANKLHKTFLDHWLLDHDLSAWLAPDALARLNTVERILLARRVGGDEPARAARRIAERVELVPVSPAERRALFEALLRGAALEAGDGAGLGSALADEAASGMAGFLTGRGVRNVSQRAGRGAQDAEREEQLRALGYNGGHASDEAPAPPVDSAPAPAAPFYRAADQPRAWVEHDYWQLKPGEAGAGLVAPDAFWLDFARAPADAPFVSPHLAEAAGSTAEMLLALAFLDLPFASSEHELQTGDDGVTLTLSGPALLAVEAYGPAEPADDAAPVLVNQEVVRNQRDELPEPLGDTLVRGEVYVTRVVLSNPTPRRRDLELLMQVPGGAVPLGGARATVGRGLRLEPYATQRVDLAFYLPRAGETTLFGAHVSEDGRRVGAAAGRRFTVLEQAPATDTRSWEHMSQVAPLDELLVWLEQANVFELELPDLAWRMHDPAAFKAITDALRARGAVVPELWVYGLLHEDARTTGEFLALRWAPAFGPWLDTQLLRLDPVARGAYEHVEFDPLHLARAHRLGGVVGEALPALEHQYERLLEILALKPAPDDEDWLEVTVYLLMQGRLAEAHAAFARVERGAVEARLQYDSLRAWLAVSRGDVELARSLAEAHADEPVPHWQARFAQVLAQLDEAAGGASRVVDPEDRGDAQGALAASAPALDFELDGHTLVIRSANLSSAVLNTYGMDVESLFSASPFVTRDAGSFALIRPTTSERVALDPSGTTRFELPAGGAAAHRIVELRAGGLVSRRTLLASDLDVQLLADYGQLQVRAAEGGAPLPGVYVKVYALGVDGEVRFHKDGYSDLRGRFDYASLSATGVPATERFALLVLSEEHGAALRETAPPAR